MIKNLAICFLLAMLFGCSGVTKYQVKTPDGVEVDVFNTKDYESYELTAKKQQDGSWSVKLKENGVSASDPMATMSESVNKLIDLVPTVTK